MPSDVSIDASYDGRWLTYQELAEVRRISKTSAIRLVMRHRWRRQRDNQGGVRVLVPADMLAPDRASHDAPYDASSDASPAFETALTAIEAAHAAEVAALRAQADVSEQGRLAAQALADAALANIADMGSRLERADERADRLERDLSGALEVASKAVQAADDLRADLAAADRTRAEATAELRGELTSTQAELAQQRILTDQARQYASEQEQEAQQALQAAHELRRANDARKARGRLRRAWDGWRGR